MIPTLFKLISGLVIYFLCAFEHMHVCMYCIFHVLSFLHRFEVCTSIGYVLCVR